MRQTLSRIGCVLLLFCPSACSPRDTSRETADQEEVRRAFAGLQAALESGDMETLWDQLDQSFHQAAEREATEMRAAYAKASPRERGALAKDLQLEGDELAQVTGKWLLRTRKFRELNGRILEATILSIELNGDWATIWYRGDDGEEQQVVVHREDGRWKATLLVR
jgi:hypothetical protein